MMNEVVGPNRDYVTVAHLEATNQAMSALSRWEDQAIARLNNIIEDQQRRQDLEGVSKAQSQQQAVAEGCEEFRNIFYMSAFIRVSLWAITHGWTAVQILLSGKEAWRWTAPTGDTFVSKQPWDEPPILPVDDDPITLGKLLKGKS